MENALFEFMYSTGCRIGEVVKLNRDDINFQMNSVIVHRKGDKEREVYFNTRCFIWLKRYFDERDDEEPCLFITERRPKRRMRQFYARGSLYGWSDRDSIYVTLQRLRSI